MGTEGYWQRQKQINEMNKSNIHPVIDQTMKDKKELVSRKHAKEYFVECLKGALFIRQYALSDDLTVHDASMLICRDMGCELQYCQSTLSDPYDRPYENCDMQFRALNKCIAQEQDRYLSNPERSIQEQVLYMLEHKKNNKYAYILKENNLDENLEQKLEMTIRL